MKIIGLTGSIAMGKSATARMFLERGVPVNDSDAVVHELYRNEAVDPVSKLFPQAISSGIVDRVELGRQVLNNPEKLKQLEKIVHPLVERKRNEFLAANRNSGIRLVVVDIPLLFEIGGEQMVDVIVVVSASPAIQRERALARAGMTSEKLAAILDKQMPDNQKRMRAHSVIRSDFGFEFARHQVQAIIRALA